MDNVKFINYPEVIFKGVYPKEYTETIEWAGRQSTATESKGKSKQFTEARVKEGHLSLGRFVTAQFEVHCSRNTSMQLLRHKFLDFCQLSQRYAIQEPHFIVPPAILKTPIALESYQNSCIKNYEIYESLIKGCEIKKEDARFILPGSCITSLAVTMNLQAARDFLVLRLDKHAQWEIRTIAVLVGNSLLQQCYSLVFDLEDKIKKAEKDLIKIYGNNIWLPIYIGRQ